MAYRSHSRFSPLTGIWLIATLKRLGWTHSRKGSNSFSPLTGIWLIATKHPVDNICICAKFQSPYGDLVNSNNIDDIISDKAKKFQSPYGDLVNSNFFLRYLCVNCLVLEFQSPYGDLVNSNLRPALNSSPDRSFQSPYGDLVNSNRPG